MLVTYTNLTSAQAQVFNGSSHSVWQLVSIEAQPKGLGAI